MSRTPPDPNRQPRKPASGAPDTSRTPPEPNRRLRDPAANGADGKRRCVTGDDRLGVMHLDVLKSRDLYIKLLRDRLDDQVAIGKLPGGFCYAEMLTNLIPALEAQFAFLDEAVKLGLNSG